MGYSVTVYFNDEDIYSTRIYGINGFVNVTKYYGNTAYSASGFDGTTTFTATPKDGCEFTAWKYRIGDEIYDESIDPRESNINPFVYSGTEDILIRAEGKSTADSPWIPWHKGELNISSFQKSVTLSLEEYGVYRYTVVFDYSGYAHFYTTGDIDTVGYLSDKYNWNDDYSGPMYEIALDDDSGDGNNFDIEYYVTAGVEYNIYVRGLTGEESGAVTLVITEPWELDSSSYGTLSTRKVETIILSPNILYCRAVSFVTSGTVTIFTQKSDSYVDIWLSTSSTWSRGKPTSFVASDNIPSSQQQHYTYFNVEAGQVYYIWIRSDSVSSPVLLSLQTIPPASTSVAKWSWSTSNGSATASQTSAAYNAVVNKTAVTNFSYLVWNDLVDKVKEILDATGDSWDSSYATYANTRMSSSSKTLTATKFNSLRYNIGSHYNTGINNVAPNDDVLGSYFTKLTSCINGWIDTL